MAGLEQKDIDELLAGMNGEKPEEEEKSTEEKPKYKNKVKIFKEEKDRDKLYRFAFTYTSPVTESKKVVIVKDLPPDYNKKPSSLQDLQKALKYDGTGKINVVMLQAYQKNKL